MTYCINPECPHPEVKIEADICPHCGSSLILAGSYRPVRPIGEGGFGKTFLAEVLHGEETSAASADTTPQEYCAIKQFSPQNQGSQKAQKAAELFRQEAVRLELLGKHPQIPEFIAYMEDNGRQYLVQEWIEGKLLSEALTNNRPFDERKIRLLLKELLPVLQFIHSHHVIHRDIKPENIIYRRRRHDIQYHSRWCLVDFGAAKFAASARAGGRTGTVIGSAAYTAPEQLRGKAVFASDIYSLGVTCIHLLTQTSPFDLIDSGSGGWVWRDYLQTPVSEDLGHILDKMLSTSVGQRYHSAAQVLKALKSPVPVCEVVADRSNQVVSQASGDVVEEEEEPEDTSSGFKLDPNRRAEIQQILQAAVQDYPVSLQVTQSKRQLTVTVNRSPAEKVNYVRVSRLLESALQGQNLSGIHLVKIFGRVKNQYKPEWHRVFAPNEDSEKVTSHQQYDMRSRQFWLQKLQQRQFWIDIFMFFMVLFIFSQRIAIYHPAVAWLIAGGFTFVKYLTLRQKPQVTEELFVGLVVLTVGLGIINIQMVITDAFGILLAALVVASPLFYLQENLRGR
jgi:serine/threonine protein kinase